MTITEVLERAEKELEVCRKNLISARKRNAPKNDIKNLENKVEFKEIVLKTIKQKLNG